MVKDAMDTKFPKIYENTKLSDILKILSETSNLYYPVMNRDGGLLGIISIDGIRHAFASTGLSDLVVAADVIELCKVKIDPESRLLDAKNMLTKRGVGYLPVIGKDNKLAGFLERKALHKFISLKIVKLHENAKSLENTQ